MNRTAPALLFLAAILLTACNTSITKRTEIDIDSISLQPNWGDEVHIELELNKRRTTKQNSISQMANSISTVELSITKGINNTWDGTWQIKDVKTPVTPALLDKKIENLMNGFVYYFIIDSSGTITELINWQEIQAKGFAASDIIIDEIKHQPGVSAQMQNQMRSNIREMFDTKEKIETYLMQEIQLYFAIGGLDFVKTDTIEGYNFISHPLTGDLIGQQIKTYYQKAYSDSTCDIQLTQTIDNSDLQQALNNTVNKIAPEDKTAELQSGMEELDFDVSITSDYNISFKTGLVEKVISRKEIKVGDNLRVDVTEIRRK